MYYKVIYKGKAYYSKEIVRSFCHIGDDVIQRRVLSGELGMERLMDRMLYALPEADHAEIDTEFSPVVQDIDARLAGFYSDAGAELAGGSRVPVNPKAERYELDGLTFVKFSEVRSRSRYREQSRLPVVEVCGVKYVALGVFKDASETMYAL